MRYFVACAVAVSFLFGCKVSGNPSDPGAPTGSPTRNYDELRDRMRETIPQLMGQHGAAGLSIAVVDGQEVVWVESFGVARREGGVPATNRTSYEVGSLSKLLVGIAVMQLVEAGELDLDAPLTDYISEFQMESRFPGERVPTLRQLLSHRGGIPADIPGLLERDDYAISQLPDALRAQWLVQPPGRMAVYSSVGIDLAALVVERRTGREFSALLEASVLEPLGMPRASLRAEDVATGTRAAGYDWTGQPAKPIGYTPSGSLRASITELAQVVRWANGDGEVGGSEVLAAQSVAEMMRPQNADRPLDLGVRVGLTWFVHAGSEATGDIVRQIGSTDGFMSEIKILPKHRVGVVALGNSKSLAVLPRIVDETLALALQVKAGLDLTTELQDVDAVPVAPQTKIDARRLGALAAAAYSDGTTLLRFEHRRGQLRAPLPGKRSLVLVPRDDGTFAAEVRKLGRPAREPFPAPRVSFETLDGAQVMVARGQQAAWVYAKRFEAGDLSRGWKARVGVYRPSGGPGPVDRVHLGIEDGALRIEARVPGQGEPLRFVLEAHSDTLATVAGLGRGSGAAVVAFERDGKHYLRAQGLEFVRDEQATRH